MKIGLSTACLYLKQYTEDAIATIKSLGAETAEIFLGTFYEYRPEFAQKFAPRAEGLEINSVHTFTNNFEPMLFNRSRRVRGDGYYWLDQLMRSAQIFGCKNYSFHGITRKSADQPSNFDLFAETLSAAAEFCSGYGVRLCLENVFWSTYNRPGVFTEIKNRAGSLWGVFDIKQARRSGYPYAMYIEEMAGSISHVHLSDVRENGKMCLPGRGVYDFAEILKRLKGAGFDGNVLIEVYPEDYDDISELKASLEFLKEIAYKI